MGGFCDVQVQFHYDSFIILDDLSKKKVALETLMKGIQTVAAEKSWDIEPFKSVYTKIVEAKYKNEWRWGKSVISPNRKFIAQLFLQHEVSQIDIFIIVNDKNGNEITKERVITEIPNEWNYTGHLGEVKWLDNKKVILVNKDKDREWPVTLL
jgi:hypothetical protein